jgi:hypothetical protein
MRLTATDGDALGATGRRAEAAPAAACAGLGHQPAWAADQDVLHPCVLGIGSVNQCPLSLDKRQANSWTPVQ